MGKGVPATSGDKVPPETPSRLLPPSHWPSHVLLPRPAKGAEKMGNWTILSELEAHLGLGIKVRAQVPT